MNKISENVKTEICHALSSRRLGSHLHSPNLFFSHRLVLQFLEATVALKAERIPMCILLALEKYLPMTAPNGGFLKTPYEVNEMKFMACTCQEEKQDVMSLCLVVRHASGSAGGIVIEKDAARCM